jgi:hypothetical protein
LIDGNQDRFDVVIAPAFVHAHVPDFGESVQLSFALRSCHLRTR